MAGDDQKVDERHIPIPASVRRNVPVIPPKATPPEIPTRAEGTGTGVPWSEAEELRQTGRVKTGEEYLSKQDTGPALLKLAPAPFYHFYRPPPTKRHPI